jgi:hypothetical protein
LHFLTGFAQNDPHETDSQLIVVVVLSPTKRMIVVETSEKSQINFLRVEADLKDLLAAWKMGV